MNEKILPTMEYSVSVRDAAFPKPFYQGLEFNAPAHGNWNIVHIGMLLPEARQIYVCADNCMRGVVLTAAEMNAADRFSFVLLDEADMTVGNIEEVTIDGVSQCIDRLDKHPPVILLFTVCVHHFLGCDLDYVYKRLCEKYPDIFFARCYMDPLLQKTKPTPDQKLRSAMYDPIRPLPVNKNVISLIGSELPLHKDSDIYRIIEIVSGHPAANAGGQVCNPVLKGLAPEYFLPVYASGEAPNPGSSAHCYKTADNAPSGGIELKEISTCTSFDEYLSMGESALFISDFPGALMGLEHLGKRLGRPYVYLPMSFDYDEISALWKRFAGALYINCISDASAKENNSCTQESDTLPYAHIYDTDAACMLPDNISERTELGISEQKRLCEEALSNLRTLIGAAEIRIDYVFHPRPLGLARLLLSHGFNVSTVYIDVISSEEEADMEWLRANAPDLMLCSTVQAEARVKKRNAPYVLAIGQKAAWFSGTSHFVNAVYGAGLWGFNGIIRLARLMEQAYIEEKDTEDLIIRKGWGCASCV